MKIPVLDFWKWSAPWRERFGALSGFQVALGLRRAIWARPKGTLVSVPVPCLSRTPLLRAGTSDPAVFFQVFHDRQADFPVEPEPEFIVDAGANIGLTAMVFASRFPHAKIMALEIDRENFELLVRNTNHFPNVHPKLKALWTHRGKIYIENPAAASWSYRAMECNNAQQDGIEALGVKDILDDCEWPRIDLLKIDIEGSELEVLTQQVDEWADRVRMIAVEIHERVRPGCLASISENLARFGFQRTSWAEYLIFRRDERAQSTNFERMAARTGA